MTQPATLHHAESGGQMTHSRLRVLWLSHFVPFPPKGGCFQRSYNLLKQVGMHHDIHLVALRHKASTHPEAETREARAELLRHCRSVDVIDIARTASAFGLGAKAMLSLATATPFNVTVYRAREVRQAVRTLTARYAFDVAHFDTVGLAQYRPDVGPIPSVMTHHGAESHMIRRRIRLERNGLKKMFFAFEWLTLRAYERAMCPRFGANIVMSDDDGDIMREVAPAARFTTVPNGVDLEYFSVAPPVRTRSLVFAGRLDQYSNRDGILHFVETAWPALRARYPEAVLHVLGSNAPERLRRQAASDERLNVPGFVPDVRPYFRDATAAICPLRDGGGTRLKVLDALAQGVPLVSTTIGCEGIAVKDGTHVLIADTPEAFVHQLSRVFDDEPLRRRLAASGRALMEARYSWPALATTLIGEYRTVAAGAAAAAAPAGAGPRVSSLDAAGVRTFDDRVLD